jgi:hypothetical protein
LCNPEIAVESGFYFTSMGGIMIRLTYFARITLVLILSAPLWAAQTPLHKHQAQRIADQFDAQLTQVGEQVRSHDSPGRPLNTTNPVHDPDCAQPTNPAHNPDCVQETNPVHDPMCMEPTHPVHDPCCAPETNPVHDPLCLLTDPDVYPNCSTDPVIHPGCAATNPNYDPDCPVTNPTHDPDCGFTDPVNFPACNTDPQFHPFCDTTNPCLSPVCAMTNPDLMPDCGLTDPDFYLECDQTNPSYYPSCSTDPQLWPDCITIDAIEGTKTFSLRQNYPNPFNPRTTIHFSLDQTQVIALTIYAIDGSVVDVLVDGLLSVGEHNLSFDASTLASGMYIYELKSNSSRITKKMLLVR